MQNQVEILVDDMNNVVCLSKNNPEYGYIKLEYKNVSIDKNNWLKPITITTLIMGKTKNLTVFVKSLNGNMKLPGKIIIIESLTPFDKQYPDKNLKYAGDTGIICCLDGEPIYRKTEYTNNINATNTLIDHNNNDVIREANMIINKTIEKIIPETTAQAFGLGTDDSIINNDTDTTFLFNKDVVEEEEDVVEDVVEDVEEEIEEEIEEEESFEL